MIRIVQATEDHVEKLAPHMREADRAEVRASGNLSPQQALLQSLDSSVVAKTFLVNGQVVAMFGVRPLSLLSNTGFVWMLGSDLVNKYQKEFLRRCKPELGKLLDLYPTLMNAIDERNTVSLRWAKWMGFEISEPKSFGYEGRPFCHIRISRIERMVTHV